MAIISCLLLDSALTLAYESLQDEHRHQKTAGQCRLMLCLCQMTAHDPTLLTADCQGAADGGCEHGEARLHDKEGDVPLVAHRPADIQAAICQAHFGKLLACKEGSAWVWALNKEALFCNSDRVQHNS